LCGALAAPFFLNFSKDLGMRSRLLHAILPWLALLMCWPAWADSPAQALVQADAGARAELIERWAAEGQPAQAALMQALAEGRLYQNADGKAYVQTDAGFADADSGQAVKVDESTLEAIPLNNRVRAALDIAHAARALSAPEASARLAALRTLADASSSALLPLLDAQLKQETDPAVRAAIGQVSANLRLSHADAAQRKQAVIALADSADPAVRTRLQALTEPANEPDASVRAAAASSVKAMDSRLFMFELLGHAFSGVSLGSVLLLAALGLAITYGLLGVINMAHGEMLMLGAYSTYVVQTLFRQYWPEQFGAYLIAALPVAFVVTALIGMALERLVIRHLYGRPLETLLATWGISLMLMQSVRVLFGAQNVEVANPDWLSGGWQLNAALTLPYNRIAIIGFVLAVLLLTWLLLNKTRLGLFVRAVTQNRRMADCVGVPTGRVDMLAFGLGSGIAGLGGVALSQIGNVGPDLGQGYIVDSFMVVVLGGVGQLAGTMVGAMGLGMVNKILEPQVGAVLGKIAILAFIILFIQKRPQGLFALKGRVID
jgi:urea transport system permease protein